LPDIGGADAVVGHEPNQVRAERSAEHSLAGARGEEVGHPRFAAGTKLEGERATLLDYLRGYRLTMEVKCAGLDPAQLARRLGPAWPW
jgi:hypothetical protein